MSVNDTASTLTKLEVIGTIEETCISTDPTDLANFILNNFVVASSTNERGITVGNTTPSPDERSNIWFRFDNNNNPLGIFYFNGQSREWVTYPTQVVQQERVYFRFDPTLDQADMPAGYVLDDNSLLSRDQRTDENGKLVYAYIKLESSPL